MTDNISARLREPGSRSEVELHEDREEAADHIDALEARIKGLETMFEMSSTAWDQETIGRKEAQAKIKSLVEALSKCAAPCGNWNMQDLIDIASDALDAAKETTPDARPMTVAEADVNKLAEVLMAEWKRADPKSNVAQYMTSYVATFADMARAALRALSEGGE